jgi:hypothetical protein
MIFRKAFGIWWTLALFLALMQGFVMSRMWWFIPLAFLVSISFGFAWFRMLKWKHSNRVLLGICILHFIPLVLGIVSLSPTFDQVVFAGIGYLLYLVKK